ncbi:hypothetical protein C9374_007777 [Naegleria lovaniensis]|uniref:Uncharacterized protein n=1 Tax=Naegleria lovaniensis TaxID=51637 RepID=A0AA88KLQ0_NAELO|nr:uncharacterized protein C9374_007777 [Naegleria lovaniensis]KAG2379139.1 hypothetical protein C9374_007777 [Naegleria lovaniensis]
MLNSGTTACKILKSFLSSSNRVIHHQHLISQYGSWKSMFFFHTSITTSFYWQIPSDIKLDGKVSRAQGSSNKPKHHDESVLFEDAKNLPQKRNEFDKWQSKEISATKDLSKTLQQSTTKETFLQNNQQLFDALIQHINCMLLAPNAKSMIHFYEKLEHVFDSIRDTLQQLNDPEFQNSISQEWIKKFRDLQIQPDQSYVGFIGLGRFYLMLGQFEQAKSVFLTLNLIDNQMGIEKGGTGHTDYPALYFSFVYLIRIYHELKQWEKVDGCRRAILDIEGGGSSQGVISPLLEKYYPENIIINK